MDSLRIEAIASRCIHCSTLLGDAHRVTAAYRVGDLLYARQELEVGFFVGDVRPFWQHVDCSDPKLLRYALRPALDYCIRCKQGFKPADVAVPVMQIVDPKGVNPNDPTDTGLYLGDRIYFAHLDCGDQTLMGRALVVG